MADTEPLALQRLDVADLRAVILALPEGYRAVFNLYEVEGFMHSEIAQALGISIGTSRSQLSRAKSLLRQRLDDYAHRDHIKTLMP